MYCPLMSMQKCGYVYCMGDECAWWNEAEGKYSVNLIAETLKK